jgi:aminopeptidase N
MSGFYRVKYSEPMFNALLPVFREKKIGVQDRFNIANDLFALVGSGKVPATRFLELVKQSAEEDEYTVWRAIDGGVGSLQCVLEHHSDTSVLARFDKFISECYAPLAEKFGWESADKGEGGKSA